jgi:hypothetical protein
MIFYHKAKKAEWNPTEPKTFGPPKPRKKGDKELVTTAVDCDDQSSLDLESVQFYDLFEDDNGKALGVLSVEWKDDVSSKQLRTICSR